MGLLDGKVALITGAGGGLGEAYAKLFAREGAAIVVNDLGGPRDGTGGDASMAQKVVDAIKADGGRAVANGADISTMAGGQSVFDDTIKNFGRADILVNNAGILLDQTFAKATEAAWDKVLKVHLKGTFCCTQPVFRWMRENGGGVIVNTASTSGTRYTGSPQIGYASSKAAIIQFSRVTAVQYARNGIRVNTVVPGQMHTPMVEARLAKQRTGGDIDALLKARVARIPLGFMGDGRDTAAAVLFLASDEARFITGTEIVVDGGMTARCD